MIQNVCNDWAKATSNALRMNPPAKAVRKGISGKAVRYGGASVAIVTSEEELGLWIEQGTGIYGPFRRPIRAKGGPYVDARGVKRNRRMLRWKGTTYTATGFRGSWRATGAGGGGQYAELFGGVSYKASKGYIFAYEVKGSPARPWFFSGIDRRLHLLEWSLKANMAAATEAIRMGGAPLRGLLPG